MGYSYGLLPGRHDPSTQTYPIALPPLASNSHSGEAVGPTRHLIGFEDDSELFIVTATSHHHQVTQVTLPRSISLNLEAMNDSQAVLRVGSRTNNVFSALDLTTGRLTTSKSDSLRKFASSVGYDDRTSNIQRTAAWKDGH